MSFKDNLRPGSFRGVSFFIDTSALTTGRRAVQHEYPNRDLPFTEDLGRIPENFEIEGHVLGDNYFEAKENLLRVFTQEGSGELIHPFWGSRFVQVGQITISESNLEGAIAKFSAKFYESGDSRFPKGANDKGALLGASADDSISAAQADFVEDFSITGLPAFAVDSARAAVEFASDTFNDITKLGATIADAATELAFKTRSLVAEVNDLLQAPNLLAERLLDSFALLEESFQFAEDQADAFSGFFNFGEDDVTGDTPVRDQERKNKNAFNNFMRRVAAVKAANSAASGEYLSFEDALAKREEISAVLEAQLALDDGTEVFQSLADVNAKLIDALPDVDADLPNLKEVTTEDDSNSLLLSYDLFESLDNEDDLIQRNGIRNPAVIAAGTRLEVIDG